MVITYTVSTTVNSGQMTTPCVLIDAVASESTDTTGTDAPAADEQVDTTTLNFANNWRDHFDNLPDVETIEGQPFYYRYYVKEIAAPDGFETTYSANNTAGITGGKLVITNTSTANVPILPATGGGGTAIPMALGAIMAILSIFGAAWQIAFSPNRKRQKPKHSL